MKKIIVIVVGLAILILVGFYLYKILASMVVKTGQSTAIPQKILDNQYGFLSGGKGQEGEIVSRGAAWIRPHPGPFLWDRMQQSQSSEIDFSGADEAVKRYQKLELGTLATLWPFADWDQEGRGDASACQVSSQDEFLPRNDKKDRGDYLPLYRCNPHNWLVYQTWVKQVVERYDGDGTQDMPGLAIPLKYWEVMNEPDLQPMPGGEGEKSLQFFRGQPADYAELLIKTSQAIKEADPEAQVLIAGAAGGNEHFLSFYREILARADVQSSFDIANVHCISNDAYDSFNVRPYKNLLKELKITKPIWVTEAEAIISNDTDTNASQTYESTRRARELGAERIFFTRYDFQATGRDIEPSSFLPAPSFQINGANSQKAYQEITNL